MSIGTSSKIAVKIKNKPNVLVNQSGIIIRKLENLADIDLSAKEDGSLLIYDEQTAKFKASRLLDKQEMNGGHF
jgi:hypothetical protein